MITAITPTGDRPLTLELIRRWLAAQTVKVDQWLVIDDGKTPLTPTPEMEYVRREPKPGEPAHTLAKNLAVALPRVKGDKVLIIEDDEYYAPGYVAAMSRQLDIHTVAGIGQSRYYHLPSGGYLIIGNMHHASLAQTGFRSTFIPRVKGLLAPGKIYIDFHIWEQGRQVNVAAQNPPRMIVSGGRRVARPVPRAAQRRPHGWGVFTDSGNPLYVGMKGMPGRAGIGRGHDPKIYRFRDSNRSILKQWIPKDYQVYLDILAGKHA